MKSAEFSCPYSVVTKEKKVTGMESPTPRELEVLRLIAEGRMNKEIAAALQISEHTVNAHVSSLLSKFHSGSRLQAVLNAVNAEILEVNRTNLGSLIPSYSLTPTQKTTLERLTAKESDQNRRKVAQLGNVSEDTVKDHLQNAYKHLGVNGQIQAVLVYRLANQQLTSLP